MNRDILKMLEKNAHSSVEDIATMLGLTTAEVAAEIDDMEKKGVICGYKALVDWEKLYKAYVSAMIELKVTPRAGLGFEEVAEKVSRYSEVESVYLMSGSYDLSLLVKGKSFQEVAMFVSRELATIDSVVSTATHFVLRRYKEQDTILCFGSDDDRGNYLL